MGYKNQINHKTTKLYCAIFVYLSHEYLKRFVQPVVQPVVQLVVQPAVKCKRILRRLSLFQS